MYAQTASITGAGSGSFAAIGYTKLALILGVITVLFAVLGLRQLVRRSADIRP